MESEEIVSSRSMQKTFRKEIYRKFLLAVKRYKLLEEGDKVAVCLSGGKDSLALAICMRELSKYSLYPFTVRFLSMDPGYTPENRQKLLENAKKLGLELDLFDSPIFQAIEQTDCSPCHICAAMRRGYLYKEARKLGCNKIALGHHLDDVVETILISQLYGGEYKTMMPILNSLNYPGMKLIRPLYLVREKDIIRWANYMNIDTLRCACKMTKGESQGKRQEVKNLIAELEKKNPPVVWNIFHAIESVNLQTVLGFRKNNDSEIESFLNVGISDE